MGKIGRILLVTAFAAFMTTTANAGYLVSVVDNATGMSQAEVPAGGSFTIGVLLEGVDDGTGQTHDTAVFDVVFSQAGLIFEGYSWASPYLTGGGNDNTVPKNNAAPLPLGMDGLSFGAITESGPDGFGLPFGVGTVATVDLTVPANWQPIQDSIEITVVPDADAPFVDFTIFDFPTTTVGSPFTLRIVPEPATLALLGIGGIAALRRRRRA